MPYSNYPDDGSGGGSNVSADGSANVFSTDNSGTLELSTFDTTTLTASGTTDYGNPTDATVLLLDATTGNKSIHLVAASTSPGKLLVLKRIDNSVNSIVVTTFAGDTFGGDPYTGEASTSIGLSSSHHVMFLLSNGSNKWQIISNNARPVPIDLGGLGTSFAGSGFGMVSFNGTDAFTTLSVDDSGKLAVLNPSQIYSAYGMTPGSPGITSSNQELLTSSNSIWIADTTSNDIEFRLPPAADCFGKMFIFKKGADDNLCTITQEASGSESIDGYVELPISLNGEAVWLVATETPEWRILGHYVPGFSQKPTILTYYVAGTLTSGATRYLSSGGANAGEVSILLKSSVIAKNITVTAVTAPGSGKTDTFTLRKNGSDTALVLTLAESATSNSSSGSVSFISGDKLSVQMISDTLTATADIVVTVELF